MKTRGRTFLQVLKGSNVHREIPMKVFLLVMEGVSRVLGCPRIGAKAGVCQNAVNAGENVVAGKKVG